MDKEFSSLRKKLSVLATAAVFSITLLVGSGFISYQYWRGYQDAEGKIRNYQSEVSRMSIVGSDLKKLKDDPASAGLFKNFFFIVDDSGAIRYNHSPYQWGADSRETAHVLHERRNFEDDGYLFSRFPLESGWQFVAIVFLPYSAEKYAADLAEYTGFLALLSLLIYLAVSRLVGYVLKPVEENMKTMRYFVQVAGHELKTPLASILSGIQLLVETKEYDEETVRDIEGETKKAGELISSLSELSSLSERTPKEEVHISEILYEALKSLDAAIKGKKLVPDVRLVNDVTVTANRYYALIFVSNLLSNAVKYSSPGGSVRIVVDDGKLTVKDDGVGIGKSHLSRIFDAFYRVSQHRERSEGLGLGLALVKKISTQYGWKVSVRSEEGAGTEFEVLFKN